MEVFGNNNAVYSVKTLDYKHPLNQSPSPVNFSLLAKFIQDNAIQGVFDAYVQMGLYFDNYHTPQKALSTLKCAVKSYEFIHKVKNEKLKIMFTALTLFIQSFMTYKEHDSI